ncbi:ECF subfamily RNA polymerase sigma-24 factor, partial [mine drainage metagenome]
MTQNRDDSDRPLVRAARDGDRAAFSEIVRRHKTPLYQFVRRYVGDADDAYDILQETFVAAWQGMRRFDVQQTLTPWLRTIALNKCRD